MASFKEIIHEFTGTSNVGLYMIHLERATERVPYIRNLEQKLNTTLTLFPAADGVELVKQGHPVRCAKNPTTLNRPPGDIGCTVSHINICKDALKHNYDSIVIFEDDCEFISTLPDVRNKLKEITTYGTAYDLIILGGSLLGYTHVEGTSFNILRDFNETHSCILNKRCMKELIDLYESYYTSDVIFAIDGMYSNLLQSNKIVGCGFNVNLFKQNRNLYSYVINGMR